MVVGATARFGARYVATRAAYAIAGHAALESFAEYRDGGGRRAPCLFRRSWPVALREFAVVPIIGMVEASCRLAARDGRRFAIVSGASLLMSLAVLATIVWHIV